MKLADGGEDLACSHLRRKGFSLVERNFRLRFGEIDIIARKGSLLVFCEVKTRESVKYGRPFEAVTHSKQQRIRRLAEAYLAMKNPSFEDVRFDVISIEHGIVDHIENAF